MKTEIKLKSGNNLLLNNIEVRGAKREECAEVYHKKSSSEKLYKSVHSMSVHTHTVGVISL